MVSTFDLTQQNVQYEDTGFEITISQNSEVIDANSAGTYGFRWELLLPDSSTDSTVELVSNAASWKFSGAETIKGVVRASNRVGFRKEKHTIDGIEYNWFLDLNTDTPSSTEQVTIDGTTYEFGGVEEVAGDILAQSRTIV